MGVQATSKEARRANPSLQALPFKFLDGPMTHHGSLATLPVAFLSIISPWWLPTMEHFSQLCASLLPVLGVGWLILQAVWLMIQAYFWMTDRRNK
jgi:hypothetical protein